MNKESARLAVYLTGIVLCIALFSTAAIFKRLELASLAFGVLGFGWLIEKLFWGSERRKISIEPRQKHTLGVIEIEGTLTISDKLSLEDSAIVRELPRGRYSVFAETRSDDRGVYVARLLLLGSTQWVSPRREEIRIPVDTGFMILVGVEKSDEIVRLLTQLQADILSARHRTVDAEVLSIGERNVAVVTTTGMGDGQYSITIGFDEKNLPVIACHFLD